MIKLFSAGHGLNGFLNTDKERSTMINCLKKMFAMVWFMVCLEKFNMNHIELSLYTWKQENHFLQTIW